MGKVFKQSRVFLRLEAEILEEGVRFVEKDVLRSYERLIPYPEIVESQARYFSVNRIYLLISVALVSLLVLRCHTYFTEGTVTLSNLLWVGFWALAASLGTWVRAVRYVGFHATGGGIFFFDQKGTRNPSEFLDQIMEARRRYFERLYHPDQASSNVTDPNWVTHEQEDPQNLH